MWLSCLIIILCINKFGEMGGQKAWGGGRSNSLERWVWTELIYSEREKQSNRGESEIPFVYRLIKFGKSPSWSRKGCWKVILLSSTNQRLHKRKLNGLELAWIKILHNLFSNISSLCMWGIYPNLFKTMVNIAIF